MIGTFTVLMWYFLLVLYMGQIKGVFGKYEPITYKTGCTLWGICYIISGVYIIKSAKSPGRKLIVSSLVLSVVCMVIAVTAIILTVLELSTFRTVSYKNYGQAKLGREVSRVLLVVYHLEVAIAITNAICMCSSLNRRHDNVSVPEEPAETTL
ncbi:membrane-spanning 4-domains subfamily A member 13 isoform X2 [Cavia porcellus]